MIDPAMARIDFYLLAASGESSRQMFACRLAEKAWRLQHTVHIRATDSRQARQLDDLLWTFRDGSFVPHDISGAAPGSAAPTTITITIGFAGHETDEGDLLINLTDELPEGLDTFPRVAEIVTSDELCRQRSRKRFAEYRSRGHDLQIHEL
ncbi:MAG: DNA polymerase III subunit chi [Woeseiaceae bacterium]